ncbi:MAG: addiction module toxin RelE [Rhodospirillaceae bacterium]|nr:addiction module toxin RelE [Rhodospirillaceae bacterium]
MPEPIVSVKATQWFDAWARKLWTESEYTALREYLAARPDAGPVIPGTGGARKLRWSLPGRGKRGGARIVYVYFLSDGDVYLLVGYTKAEKADLSPKERAEIKGIVSRLKGLRT